MRHDTITLPSHATRHLDAAWPIAIASIVALQIALVVAHAPWRDEYQALQIALQSPDLAALFANLRYEGHPPLWFLLLRAAGAILPPAWVLPVVQAAIAVTTLLLILLRAPFARWMRVCIAIGPVILFEYGTVARGSSLGVMLLVLAFAARTHWLRWAAIALLPLVEFQFGLLSLALLVIMYRDRLWSWIGASSWLGAGLISAWSVRPAPDVVPAVTGLGAGLSLGRLLTCLATLLVPIETVDGAFQYGGTLPDPLWALAGPGFIAFCWLELRGRPLSSALFAAFLLATTAMTVTLYTLSLRHIALVAVLLILLIWREAAAGRAPRLPFRSWVATMGGCGAVMAVVALTVPFDRGNEAAAFIRARGLDRRLWAAYPEPLGQGIVAPLGIEMLSLPKGCTQSFVHWNRAVEFAGPAPFQAAMQAAAQRYGGFYLSIDQEVGSIPGVPMTLIADFPAGLDGTPYRLFRVGDGVAHARAPACPPPRRPLALWAR